MISADRFQYQAEAAAKHLTKVNLIKRLARAFADNNLEEEGRREAEAECRLLKEQLDRLKVVQQAIDAVVKKRVVADIKTSTLPLTGASVSVTTEISEEEALLQIYDKCEDVIATIEANAEESEEILLLLKALGLTEQEWAIVRHKYE